MVRVYEAHGQETTAVTLGSAAEIKSAWETNLIEKETNYLSVEGSGRAIRFDIGQFEIKTFLLKLASL